MLGIVKRDEFEFDRWLKKQAAKAAGILESMGLDPRELLATEIGWLVCLPKFEGKPLDFDAFQIGFLGSKASKRSLLKARQVGFSFEIACESLSRCHIKDRHTAVCVSYNLDDAKEKIARVKELHDELPLEFQKAIVIDSKTEVGFASNSSKRQLSKVISYPSKAPRGKTGDVYLDELAHCQNDRQIYAGATALTARSGGQLTIGSTPLGRRGIFHAVHSQEFERYPGYWRQEIPWWLCRHFCVDILRAVREAPSMSTEERVARFGTAALKNQFDALPLEDFQQEFELVFQDERVSFYPYELILPCAHKERFEIPIYDNLSMLAEVAPKLGPLYMGFDVGRSNHPSELFVAERDGDTYISRYEEQFKDMPFPKQRRRLFQILDTLGDHWVKFRIDETGMGKNLGEDLLERYGKRRVEPVTFTNPIKEELANNLKIILQGKRIVLPNDRKVISQIHSIKQKLTASGNAIFDAEKNRHHHADKHWAIALAVRGKKAKRKAGPGRLAARVIERETETPERSLITAPTPDQIETVAGSQAVTLRDLTNEALLRRAKGALTRAKVWRRSGDLEEARRHERDYKKARREILRRRAASRG